METPLPAEGGAGSIALTAARECAWSAAVEGAWLSIRAGATGQGDGTVEFAAVANPDPQVRRGAITANGQRLEISQSAGTCAITLEQSAASFSQTGGSGQIGVRASSSLCSWSVESDAAWIQIRTPSGRGSGVANFEVPASTAPPRIATLTVGGQKFSVTQSEGCTFAIAPSSQSVSPSGGSGSIAITTTENCPWAAVSNAGWLSVTPAVGRGPGTAAFRAEPTSGPARTGTAIVAGQLFTVTQSQGCVYSVQPPSGQVGSPGGTLDFALTTNRECPWSASTNDSWITLQGRSSGSGDATVTLNVASTTGPARSGSATIAGQRIAITQSPGCAFTISPETASAPSAGAAGKVTVTAGAGCAWTAASNASWLTIGSGTSGSGNGEVQYIAAATTGPARNGTLTVAGRTFTVNQGEGCAFTLSSRTANVDDNGGSGTFTVETAGGCAWTASSTVSWVTINSGASGTGQGTVRFTASRNTGPARSGAITAGGQTFTVRQGDGCSISLTPGSHAAPAGGGNSSVRVSSGSGCTWTATSDDSWLTIRTGANGSGTGNVEFAVAANNGPNRSGTLTIGGERFTVSQAENCRFTISPDRATVGPASGDTTVNVSTAAGCSWTASSNAPWLQIVSGASGSGNGPVRVRAQANTGAQRSGTATIAGQTFTVDQGSGCAFAIDPASASSPASGGPVPVNVTTAAGCAWTATSQAPWLTIASGGTGSGGGTVQVDVQANTGAPRSGSATIAGQTFTVSQASGCAFTVSPETATVPAASGSVRVDVTTGASCAWTATTAETWIQVTGPGGGNSSGAVDLAIAANTGPGRTCAVTVAGRTVTVTQDGGCTVTPDAASHNAPVGGGPGSVTVSAGPGCPWTAASGVPWVVITDGASGSGPGTVQFAVEANATGAPRSGTITIGAASFTVSQQ